MPVSLIEVADKIDALQSVENEGRGITCVRTIVHYLRKNMFEEAQAVFQVDGDKIRQYKKVETYLIEVLGCRLHGTYNCEKGLCKNA